MNKLSIFSVGVKLMNRLTYLKKFTLIFLLFIVPFIFVLTFIIYELNKNIEFAKQERKGIEYINELRSLVQLSQQHRGLSVVYLQGANEVKADIESRQENISSIIEKIDEVNDRLGDYLIVEQRWEDIKNEWSNIANNVYSFNSDTTIIIHNEFIKNLIEFKTYLAITSNLILDQDEANSFLVATLLEDLPYMTENMGISRAYGTAVINNKRISLQENIDLTFNLRSMDDRFQAIITKFNFAFIASPEIEERLQGEFNDVRHSANKMIELIDKEILNTASINMDISTFFSATTEAIDSVYTLMESGIQILDERLEHQITLVTFQKNLILIISITITLLIIYFFISFYLGIRNTVNQLKEKMKLFANGDLTVSTNLKTKDETREIGEAFNHMAEDFRKMVLQNKEISEQLSASSEELTASIDQTTQAIDQVTLIVEEVAKGAETQVIGATESSQASEEISKAIQKIAESSTIVSELAVKTTDKAETGQMSVNDSVQQFNTIKQFVLNVSQVIKELNEHSKEISNISSLINGVAEQTNLLALNAAIEAARAGEHGKGFAVVAGEVRKLAEETKTSTDKITHIVNQVQASTETAVKMMEQGTTEVEVGTKVVESLGTDFKEIIFSINNVSEQVHHVSALSEELSANSEEVAASVAELSQIASENSMKSTEVAASTEEQLATMQEINSAATELSKTAENLTETINKFRLS